MSNHPAAIPSEDFAIGEWCLTVVWNARKHYSKKGDPRTTHINLGKMSRTKALKLFEAKCNEVASAKGNLAADRRVILDRRIRDRRILVGGVGVWVRKSFEQHATWHHTDRDGIPGNRKWLDLTAFRSNLKLESSERELSAA